MLAGGILALKVTRQSAPHAVSVNPALTLPISNQEIEAWRLAQQHPLNLSTHPRTVQACAHQRRARFSTVRKQPFGGWRKQENYKPEK